jgi:hypothetical protein
MLMVQDILISDDVIEQQFMCNLNACKGACCWEGDFGAPLEDTELKILDQIYDQLKPYISEEGKTLIDQKGKYTYYEEPKEYGTPLLANGACAYMTYDKNGIAQCGIERAHREGVVTFKKPISCHLYPIRVNKDENGFFEALNYDRWDICSAACSKGKEMKIAVYQFAKEAIIRKYGVEFYDELEAAVEFIESKKGG